MAIAPGTLTRAFHDRFADAGEPVLYRAPGRVNMMGEHTDYNQGFVCPMAIEMACYAAVAPAAHGNLRVYSANLDQMREWPVASLGTLTPTGEWSDYVAGVAVELRKLGMDVAACDLYLDSDVPGGAGLSSSAAIEVATALALLGGGTLDRLELARLAQRAEVHFVGLPCGIMDQYASVFGEAHDAILLDCRSLESKTVRLPERGTVIVVNSRVKHELGTSAYRQRVEECAQAVRAMQPFRPEIASLRDVTVADLDRFGSSLPITALKRARHVVSDNARVLEFVAAAESNSPSAIGKLFVASHRSAQHDYEISCEELDFLVDTAITLPGVFGARMTGGGFGGCTVNLVAPEAVDSFCETLDQAYRERFSLTPLFYECTPAAGAGRVTPA